MHHRVAISPIIALSPSSPFATTAYHINVNHTSQPRKASTDFTVLRAGWSGKATVTGIDG